jgi:hypothetical protein
MSALLATLASFFLQTGYGCGGVCIIATAVGIVMLLTLVVVFLLFFIGLSKT